jgi:hypothetical protein
MTRKIVGQSARTQEQCTHFISVVGGVAESAKVNNVELLNCVLGRQTRRRRRGSPTMESSWVLCGQFLRCCTAGIRILLCVCAGIAARAGQNGWRGGVRAGRRPASRRVLGGGARARRWRACWAVTSRAAGTDRRACGGVIGGLGRSSALEACAEVVGQTANGSLGGISVEQILHHWVNPER